MARMTDHAAMFKDTWPAFQQQVSSRALDSIDTDTYRVGWPSPTLYTEHEAIHRMANLIDNLLAEREGFIGQRCAHGVPLISHPPANGRPAISNHCPTCEKAGRNILPPEPA